VKENERVQHPAAAGFTMGEMVIVLAVIAILAALITPLAVNQITQSRYDAAREELLVIKQAIVGDPSLIEGGSRSSFGFVGDLGVLPSAADGLEDLVGNTIYSTFTVVYSNWPQTHASNLIWGWRGPYISEYTDPWGNEYNYTTAGLPAYIAARIWSIGADQVNGTSDDVSIDIRADEVTSMISGNTLDQCGRSSTYGTPIRIYYPAGTAGVLSIDATYTSPPIFQFASIPIGLRTITFTTATPTTVTKFITINNGPMVTFNLMDPGVCN
jgi:prepilin-type N-terminal cleavage/methylation domain-containing protein